LLILVKVNESKYFRRLLILIIEQGDITYEHAAIVAMCCIYFDPLPVEVSFELGVGSFNT